MKPAPSGNTELDQLAHLAAGADAGVIAAPGDGPIIDGAPAGPAVDPAKEWAQLPALFGMLVSGALPELKEVFTDDACRRWGEAMVPLAQKYNWDIDKFLATLGPWIGAGMATVPLAVPTIRAVRTRMAAKVEASGEGAEPAAASPSATVTQMPARTDDVELADPTKKNRPPRPVR